MEHNYSCNESNCNECGQAINEHDDGIQCEVCNFWYCIECSGMSKTFYSELVKPELNENFIWYCNGCKKAIPGVRKVLHLVSSMKDSQDKMDKRLEVMESKIDKVYNHAALSVEFRIDQAIFDFKERENRKSNVILYNVPESNSQDQEQRKVEDSEAVSKVCEVSGVQDRVDQIVRLGEKRNGSNFKPRPLKVAFSDESGKKNKLKNSSKLRNITELQRITVTPDYTLRQRNLNKQMKEEVSKRRLTDQTFTYRRLKEELSGKAHSIQDNVRQMEEPPDRESSEGSTANQNSVREKTSTPLIRNSRDALSKHSNVAASIPAPVKGAVSTRGRPSDSDGLYYCQQSKTYKS